MTREHVWPVWLIEYANVRKKGIIWDGRKNINPRTATLPICKECNHRLGSELEEPVSRIFLKLDAGNGISDLECELLIRWLWKFEGLESSFNHLGDKEWQYSDRWTLIDRVLGDRILGIRDRLTLAIGLTNKNGDHEDWPMGVDSGSSELDAIFVSGVFKRIAIMVSFSEFEGMIPSCFGLYRLQANRQSGGAGCFLPPVCFPFSDNAVTVTQDASIPLKMAHERFAKSVVDSQMVKTARLRIEIPDR